MKTILYTLLFLSAFSITANTQTKITDNKWKNNFLQHMQQNQNSKGSNQKFGLKINSYWKDVDAPHFYNSYMPQIKVPCFNTVWARVNFDSLYYDSKVFVRTADGGKTWRFDSIPSPAGYALGSLSAIDGNTCYASMYDGSDGQGGGIYKTTNGGAAWKHLEPGKLLDDNSFADFVYFFDAKNGLAVGDNDGTDTSTLQIYTTCDEGKTWQRVPKQNIPPTLGYAYSFNFNVYTVFKNRIWFRANDSYGNSYIYRSDDLGHHWQLSPYTLATPIFDFAFTDKLNGLGISFDFGVGPHEVETHDGGITWADKSFTGYPMGGFITVIPGTHTFVSTLPYGLTPVTGSSYSNDYGATWKLIDSGVNASHSAVAYLNPLIGWTGRAESADPNGGMFKWKINFLCDGFDENISNTNILKTDLGNENIIKLYPNPAKDIIRVEGLNPAIKTTLLLFNISGKLIQQSCVTEASHTFNLPKLTAGNYYIKIESGNNTTTLNFLKQ